MFEIFAIFGKMIIASKDVLIKYRSFAKTVSQLKICDFSGETFKGFEVL